MITGTVLYGINNIYTISVENKNFECRIKGKKLKNTCPVYNPLAPGDLVLIEKDTHSPDRGMILSRLKRKNEFTRWNKKRKSIQTIAANLDLLACISSPLNPSFRPRFIDRVLISAEPEIPVIIILNKCDLDISDMIMERLNDYKKIGYKYIICSAKTGDGIEEIKSTLKDKNTAFVGQSGVGKSSILNAVNPELKLKTGEISLKYNKGSHTTCYSIMIPFDKGNGHFIDTPGVREFDLCGIEPYTLASLFPDFYPFINKCPLNSCVHLNEPECAVKTAVSKNLIHPDRYESYKRIFSELENRESYGRIYT